MSIWIKASEQLPPTYEAVLILYKDNGDDLTEENLYYEIAYLTVDPNLGYTKWSSFTQYPDDCTVLYWTRLPDKPRLEREWYD